MEKKKVRVRFNTTETEIEIIMCTKKRLSLDLHADRSSTV